MPTFTELQQQMTSLLQRRAILTYLVEHIDENFLPSAGGQPKRVLVDDVKLPVPVEAFEGLVADTLTAEIEQINHQVATIEQTALAVPTPPPPPAQPEPRVQRKGRRAAQPEGAQQ